MENYSIVIFVLILLVLVVCGVFLSRKKQKNSTCCCHSCNTPKSNSADYPHKTIIVINGMSCGHCSSRVESAFAELGNCVATVNLEQKIATVLSKEPLDQTKIEEMIKNLGFIPNGFTVEQ